MTGMVFKTGKDTRDPSLSVHAERRSHVRRKTPVRKLRITCNKVSVCKNQEEGLTKIQP